mgnify:CR=1 FL=1
MSNQDFEDQPDAEERLQKVLARFGIGSRRTCELLISAGRVTVDGEIAQLGRKVRPLIVKIEVDNVAIGVRPGLVYYLLNKPKGVITTAKDPQGRSTILELVPESPRVFPVGRLDIATEGLIILTNDGELTNYLTHPSFGIEKEYLAEVEGKPTPSAVRRLREGVVLEDGITAPARVNLLDESIIRMVIHEGKNRQIRRMCEEVGHPVKRLIRVRIGPLADPALKPGIFRELTDGEMLSVRKAINKDFLSD